MIRARILVAEDDASLAELLRYNLDKEGYDVFLATDGQQALDYAEGNRPDLALLDWMLPKMSGIDVCRRLRKSAESPAFPILMLTARTQDNEVAQGLDAGADDYITKPFSMIELSARIRAALRRTQPNGAAEVLRYETISLDKTAHRVLRGDREVHLGPTEFRLLDYLMRHPRRVFSREQLLDSIWGDDIFVETRTIDVHVGRLRKALMDGGEPNPIRTVRSAGYSLDSSD